MNVDKISPEFATALLTAQKSMNPVAKKKVNPAFKSKYATLADCQEAITEPLNDNDITLLNPLFTFEGYVGARPTVVYAKTGEILTDEGFHLAVAKNDPQGHGSAGTYVQRYALLSFFCLPTEDDDANKAQPNRPVATAVPQRPATPPNTTAPLANQAAINGYLKRWDEKNAEEPFETPRPSELELKKMTQAQVVAMYKALG